MPVVVVKRTVGVALDQVCTVAQVRDVMEVAAGRTKKGRRKGSERVKRVKRQINRSCDEEQQGHTRQGIINCLVQV